mmetsp:Transcript_21428/g.62037  ORF Transcript_21428/g.62037 Transcript_21428/m.62037 type:complete len:276 (-) Transcript_21428:66-893(-)
MDVRAATQLCCPRRAAPGSGKTEPHEEGELHGGEQEAHCVRRVDGGVAQDHVAVKGPEPSARCDSTGEAKREARRASVPQHSPYRCQGGRKQSYVCGITCKPKDFQRQVMRCYTGNGRAEHECRKDGRQVNFTREREPVCSTGAKPEEDNAVVRAERQTSHVRAPYSRNMQEQAVGAPEHAVHNHGREGQQGQLPDVPAVPDPGHRLQQRVQEDAERCQAGETHPRLTGPDKVLHEPPHGRVIQAGTTQGTICPQDPHAPGPHEDGEGAGQRHQP